MLNIPKNAEKVEVVDLPIVFYLYRCEDDPSRLCAQCFIDEELIWSDRFLDERVRRREMQKQIEIFKNKEAREKNEKNSKEAEKLASQKNYQYEIGQMYVVSWGYDQTDVNFYQVVDRVEEDMLKVQEVNKTQVDKTRVLPVKDRFVGRPFNCKAGDWIKTEYGLAGKFTGRPVYYDKYMDL